MTGKYYLAVVSLLVVGDICIWDGYFVECICV